MLFRSAVPAAAAAAAAAAVPVVVVAPVHVFKKRHPNLCKIAIDHQRCFVVEADGTSCRNAVGQTNDFFLFSHGQFAAVHFFRLQLFGASSFDGRVVKRKRSLRPNLFKIQRPRHQTAATAAAAAGGRLFVLLVTCTDEGQGVPGLFGD